MTGGGILKKHHNRLVKAKRKIYHELMHQSGPSEYIKCSSVRHVTAKSIAPEWCHITTGQRILNNVHAYTHCKKIVRKTKETTDSLRSFLPGLAAPAARLVPGRGQADPTNTCEPLRVKR